jgi:tripartite-type tricarboxylate transporter receptor subunit TctC
MEPPRREFLQLALGAAALTAMSRTDSAFAYPARPVRIFVGFPPGGTSDIAARLIAQWLSERLGQQFIVENRSGAAGNIAAEAVVRAPADGYTLLAATASNIVNAVVYQNLSFNFIRDITMIAGIIHQPFVLEVNPAFAANSVAELISYAKANPGKISLASFGAGTPSHVVGAMFKMRAGVNMIHVPYRGSAPMVTDLLGGRVQAAFDSLPSSIEHIRAGKLRALALTTATRLQALADVPTMDEFLPGFEASGWIGIGAPSGTPREIIDNLNQEINAGLTHSTINKRLADLGGQAFVSSPADLAKFVAEKAEVWGNVARAANIKAE